MRTSKTPITDQDEIQRFYNSIYYKDAKPHTRLSGHFSRLASKIDIQRGQEVLDVACGKGEWLVAVKNRGGVPAGLDLSSKAIDICKTILPNGEFYVATAEKLPFADKRFDVVSCLGAIEHFIDPEAALKEMVRTAKDGAIFLLLVPNADFLTRRLGFYGGTAQAEIREVVRTLGEWEELFNRAGLEVKTRWKDTHVLTWSWISAKRWYLIPLRVAQAIALIFWPLSWQYQVYHLCTKRRS
jgi:ubiquinone/menaquinone biosynthesis C-methylase UbiE